ncbi:MAG: hypothetical protein ABF271_02970 [Abyssibacter sp.]|uniref:hypothetical protein n=1 Tax=Abyssibacter sp. TaxID=2320200 RepID=UPI00321B860F
MQPVAAIFEKREDRKKAVSIINAERSRAQTDGEIQISLTDRQWELLSKKGEADTWKDEYITIVVTSPFILIVTGALQSAFGLGTEILDAVAEIFRQAEAADIDLGELMLWTVFAAIGIKAVK